MKKKILGLNVPTNDTIKSRTSTVAKSLATSIIPRIDPTEDEIENVKKIFTKEGKLCCAYCSEKATEWDHFHPLVVDSKPTGYITEINNLVPCCKNCNPSKGNKDWANWLLNDDTEKSPKGRNISYDVIMENYDRLLEYDKKPKVKIEYDSVEGFNNYWRMYSQICDMLNQAQKQADDFNLRIKIFKATNIKRLRFSVNNEYVGSQWDVVKKYVIKMLKSKYSVEDINAKLKRMTNTSVNLFSSSPDDFSKNKGKSRGKQILYKNKKYYLHEDWTLEKNFCRFVNAIDKENESKRRNNFKIDLC